MIENFDKYAIKMQVKKTLFACKIAKSEHFAYLIGNLFIISR